MSMVSQKSRALVGAAANAERRKTGRNNDFHAHNCANSRTPEHATGSTRKKRAFWLHNPSSSCDSNSRKHCKSRYLKGRRHRLACGLSPYFSDHTARVAAIRKSPAGRESPVNQTADAPNNVRGGPGATHDKETDDWQLFEAWRNGDRRAGELLVGRYLGVLTGFFRKKINNPDDVADLISETVLECTRAKQSVRDAGAFRGFLLSCGCNILRRHFRKQLKRQREQDDFPELCVGAANRPRSYPSLLLKQQEELLLVRALRRLPVAQQVAFELSSVQNLSGQEIAKLLGVPAPTVYSRLQRGTEKLRQIVAELADSPGAAESTIIGLQTWATRMRQDNATPPTP